MRRMEKVTGRSDDMIILRGVNVFPSQIEEALLAQDWCSGHFQIRLTREGPMDCMTIHAECRAGLWDGEGLQQESRALIEQIKNTIGISTKVVIEQPGGVERSVGKMRRVIDRRDQV